jgi:HK97 gp10 family phage protein
MSSGVRVDVIGFDKLTAQLKRLANDKDKKREVLIILRQIAAPTLNAARSLAPVSEKSHKARGRIIAPGNLKKSLGNITGKQENPTIYVGARAKGSNNGWYAHFVHEGVNVYNKGFKRKRVRGANSGAAVRRTTGNPFLTRAYQQTNGTATAEADKQMVNFIQRRIKKLS